MCTVIDTSTVAIPGCTEPGYHNAETLACSGANFEIDATGLRLE